MSILHSRIMPALAMGALLLGLPAFVHAEPNAGTHRSYRSEHQQGAHDRQHLVSHTFHSLLRHAKELGLSEEQVTKLKSLRTDYMKTRIRDKADMKLAEVDVLTLAHDEKAEMSAIESAVNRSEAAQAKLRLDGIRALRAASATLTPEQREKWRSTRAVMHAEGEDHGAHGKAAQIVGEGVFMAEGR